MSQADQIQANSLHRVATLDLAKVGQTLAVLKVEPPQNAPEWARWLEELGFIAGEQVRLMTKALPGGDPMVIRVGQSTFALRKAEAACVSVAPVEEFSQAAQRQPEFELEGVHA